METWEDREKRGEERRSRVPRRRHWARRPFIDEEEVDQSNDGTVNFPEGVAYWHSRDHAT